MLLVLLFSFVHSQVCIIGRGQDEYLLTPINGMPEILLRSSVGGIPPTNKYLSYARTDNIILRSIEISMFTRTGQVVAYCRDESALIPRSLLCAMIFDTESGDVCNTLTQYTVRTTTKAYNNSVVTTNTTLRLNVVCESNCTETEMCGGCGNCETQCQYCNKQSSFPECAAKCSQVCSLVSGGTVCNTTEITQCVSEVFHLCEGICDVCNMQESNEGDTLHCYSNWTESCIGPTCKLSSCNYTNASPKDDCHTECRNKCYIKDNTNFCPYNNYHPKQCYDQCVVFCTRPSLRIAILVSVVGFVGLCAAIVSGYSWLSRDPDVYGTY